MRSLFLGLIFLAAGVAQAAEVEFVRIWPAWRDADSFERISEYFGGGENTGREIVLRTQPGNRTGFYFLVRAKAAAATPGAKFELKVIRPDSPDAKTFTFSADLPAKEQVFQLGLTGTDWPGDGDVRPVAWRLAVIGSNGSVLAEEKSFLWEKPAK